MTKFLQELGYDDIFTVDEVKEIKSLYDKAQEEMKESYEAELKNEGTNYVEKLEEQMLKMDEVEKKETEWKLQVVDG